MKTFRTSKIRIRKTNPFRCLQTNFQWRHYTSRYWHTPFNSGPNCWASRKTPSTKLSPKITLNSKRDTPISFRKERPSSRNFLHFWPTQTAKIKGSTHTRLISPWASSRKNSICGSQRTRILWSKSRISLCSNCSHTSCARACYTSNSTSTCGTNSSCGTKAAETKTGETSSCTSSRRCCCVTTGRLSSNTPFHCSSSVR